jgi:hypothetical protein
MCYFILKANGQVESRSTVQPMTVLKMQCKDLKQRLEEFDRQVNEWLADANFIIQHQVENGFFIEDADVDEDDEFEFEEPSPIPEADDFTPDAYDDFIGAELLIPTTDG